VGARQFGLTQFIECSTQERCADFMRLEFLLDTGGAIARAAVAREHLSEALIGQQLAGLQVIEQPVQLLGTVGVRAELASQFGAAVLATRQVGMGPSQQRPLGARARGRR